MSRAVASLVDDGRPDTGDPAPLAPGFDGGDSGDRWQNFAALFYMGDAPVGRGMFQL